MRIETKPTKEQLDRIYELLSEEKNLSNTPYHDWDDIMADFKKEQIILLMDDSPIGLFEWCPVVEGVIECRNIWVHRPRRKKGVGKFFQKEINAHFSQKGIAVLTLRYVSKGGEMLSRAMGFVDCEGDENYRRKVKREKELKEEFGEWDEFDDMEEIDENSSVEYDCCRYLPLAPYNMAKKGETGSLYLEYAEYLNGERKGETICLDKGSQSFPIVACIYGEWDVRIISNGEIVEKGCAKYLFPQIGARFLDKQFLLIDEDSKLI